MSKGYFSHEHALIESEQIGDRTRVWAYAHILPGARIGADCNICDHTLIENGVVMGDRVTIKCGVEVVDGVTLEDDVFIGPNVTFTNDIFPRSRNYLEKPLTTLIERGASIGGNATILPGLRIARYAMVGAGSVVTKSVPAYAIVVGNPATIIGYADSSDPARRPARRNLPLPQSGVNSGTEGIAVKGARLIRTPVVKDLRGNLVPRELGGDLPFIPKRCFLVYDVPSKDIRGEHAHRTLHQLLICIQGSVSCILDDGNIRQEFLLDSPDLALYIPPGIWSTQHRYSADAKLMVMASEVYDSEDYIRDYDQFMKSVER